MDEMTKVLKELTNQLKIQNRLVKEALFLQNKQLEFMKEQYKTLTVESTTNKEES